ncbi:MAG: hypothetical protein II630_09040 [Bacteroidales bacterium]|nr:hypothetical protein [Bacteroidales bacterium]
MSEKCDKGLILKIERIGKDPLEFRNVSIEAYEGMKRDLASGRHFIELSGIVQKDGEACNKMSLIPAIHIQELTIEEPSTLEKEGKK